MSHIKSSVMASANQLDLAELYETSGLSIVDMGNKVYGLGSFQT